MDQLETERSESALISWLAAIREGITLRRALDQAGYDRARTTAPDLLGRQLTLELDAYRAHDRAVASERIAPRGVGRARRGSPAVRPGIPWPFADPSRPGHVGAGLPPRTVSARPEMVGGPGGVPRRRAASPAHGDGRGRPRTGQPRAVRPGTRGAPLCRGPARAVRPLDAPEPRLPGASRAERGRRANPRHRRRRRALGPPAPSLPAPGAG